MWYLVLCGALVIAWSSGQVMVTSIVVLGTCGDGLGRECQWNWEAVTLLGFSLRSLGGNLEGYFHLDSDKFVQIFKFELGVYCGLNFVLLKLIMLSQEQ